MKMLKNVKGMVCLFFMIAALLYFSSTTKAAIVNSGHQKYSYGEMKKDLDQLQKKFPEMCKVNIIGTTADKRNLYEVVLGNEDAPKHLLVIANLHAREYMTTTLCMKQIEYYLNRYNKKLCGASVKKVLDKVCIHYVPSCNPDGTAISQYGFNAIRNKSLRKKLKNMPGGSRTWKANARGVDLNRNWNVAFRKSGRPGSMGYHGTKAASEKETKAIVKLVSSIKKKGKIAGVVSYHSTGSILYGRCAGSASRYVKKQTSRMVSVARNLTGYRLMPTESISAANSCSREYFLYRKNIPCITLEVGHGSCPLGAGEFSGIWRKNKNLVYKVAMLFD